MTIKNILVLLVNLIFFSSCSDLFLTEKMINCENYNPQYTFEKDIKPIFNKYCISCHRSDNAIAGLDLSNYSEFNISKYFIPGDTTQGLILKWIKDVEDPMPPSWFGVMDRDTINMINQWILECAIEN